MLVMCIYDSILENLSLLAFIVPKIVTVDPCNLAFL
jgi:hypothetical protein